VIKVSMRYNDELEIARLATCAFKRALKFAAPVRTSCVYQNIATVDLYKIAVDAT
jgi:hypothetical protein